MIDPLLHADKLIFYPAEISSWELATVVIVSHNMAERSAILGAAESVIPGGRGEEEGGASYVGLPWTKDIQRLHTTNFSLVLRKEYFDCPQRDSNAVRYITFKEGGEGSLCSRTQYSLATVMSCIDASVRIVTKPPKVVPL